MAKKQKLPIAKTTSSVPEPYRPTKEDEARQRRYRAEDGLRVLQQAEEIKNDKRRMSDIKALAKEQMETAKKFCK